MDRRRSFSSTDSTSTYAPSVSSEGRRSFTGQLSALGARLGRVLTPERTSFSTTTGVGDGGGERRMSQETLVNDTPAPTASQPQQSSNPIGSTPGSDDSTRERGRRAFSSGRGGAGNIRRSSPSGERAAAVAVASTSPRGREIGVGTNKVLSSGRGGAGNVRSSAGDLIQSASDPQTLTALRYHRAGDEEYEREVRRRGEEARMARSTGRGGTGNISRSKEHPSTLPELRTKSKSKTRRKSESDEGGPGAALLHSTGRGGVGNVSYRQLQGDEARHRAMNEGQLREDVHQD